MFRQLVNQVFRALGYEPIANDLIANNNNNNNDNKSESSSSKSGTTTTLMAAAGGVRRWAIPPPVLSDSYKASHFREYPPAQKMVAYGEFRAALNKDPDDQRLIVYGMRYLLENYIAVPWTMEDIAQADAFYRTHYAGFAPFPWPKDLFEKFVRENRGYFPVKLEALPEGTVCYPHTPVYQITAEGEYSRLVTFLETLLTMIWYPSTVATLSRKSKQVIANAYEKSVDADAFDSLNSRLHDFGFRGCTSVEQSIIGGTAHLLNFGGSDTMSACYHAQFHLNNGKPVASSIPATEHSVMTSYRTERDAIQHMIEEYGTGVFACVMDTYDYANALQKVLPTLKTLKLEKGGFMVLRPDSGDPKEVVLLALREADKIFGSTTNGKGYKVLNGVAVIQGDGVSLPVIGEVLDAVLEAGYSAQNVAFGMGGGLLQKVNRDSMSFATKLNHIVYADGTKRDTMKQPKTDTSKFSLPGELAVLRNAQNVPTAYPKSKVPKRGGENLFKVVYDKGPVANLQWDDFDTLKAKIERDWKALPPKGDAISTELRDHIQTVAAEQRERNQAQ